jgi:hypothetical protein
MKILSIIQKENTRKATFIDAAGIRTRTFPGDWDDARIAAVLNDNNIPATDSVDYTIKPVNIDNLKTLQSGIAVCVTCHAAYLQYLQRQIDAIEAQTVKPVEKILVLDGCEKPEFAPDNWVIIRTDAKSPNPGRNLAIQQTAAKWIIFADADDTMHPDFVAAYAEKIKNCSPNIGLFYPDLHCSTGKKMINPEVYDFWHLRLHDHISMASCWRIAALKEIGGLCNFKRYDDWSMALKITRAGWVLEKQNKVPVLYNIHRGEHRSLTPDTGLECLWQAHTFGIVSLLAGRENCLADWKHWLINAELPPETTVYVLDNSGKEAFGQDVRAFLASQTRFKFFYMSYGKPIQLETWFSRHEWVPMLYNKILPYVNDDWLVFLEDDVVPPLNGLLKIMEAWDFRGKKYGGISACYPSRQRTNEYVGTISTKERTWGRMYTISNIKEDRLYPAGCIAGGFSVYQNALVKRSMPCRFTPRLNGIPCNGWDTHLSLYIRDQGYQLFLHGGVKCQHNFEDTQLQGEK